MVNCALNLFKTVSMSSLHTLRRSEVPEYLRSGELYLSFSDEPDNEISVPSDCFKRDLIVKTAHDAELVLLTLRFWLVDSLPNGLIRFLLATWNVEVQSILLEFDLNFPGLVNAVTDIHSIKPEYDGIGAAARYGRLDLVAHFIKEGVPLTIEPVQIAARHGHVECLQYLIEHFRTPDQSTDIPPAQSDWDACMAYAIKHNCDTLRIMRWKVSAAAPATSCLEHMFSEYPLPPEWPFFTTAACRGGSVACLKLMHARGCKIDETAVEAAAAGGNIQCIQFLGSLGYNIFSDVTVMAAAGAGQTKMLKWLLKQDCSWNHRTAHAAAEALSSDCLDVLFCHTCTRTCVLCGLEDYFKQLVVQKRISIQNQRTADEIRRKNQP